MPLYSLRWEAKDTAEMELILKECAEKTGIADVLNAKTWSEVFNKKSF